MAEEYQDPETVEEAVRQRAIDGVKKTSDEFGRDVEYYSINELIDADKHEAGREAAKKPHFGLRFSKLIPPGTG